MYSLNKIMLIGYLGADPKYKKTDAGLEIINMSLSTNESYKDSNGEKVEKTEWHNVVCFSKLAEICNRNLKKGSRIYIEGKVKYRKWEDEFGNKKFATDIIADKLLILSAKNESDKTMVSSEKTGKDQSLQEHINDLLDDEIPF